MSSRKNQPRFRLFAGPNGSGKTTLFKKLKSEGLIRTEIYVSPDRLEKTFKKTKKVNFNAYHVKVDEEEFQKFCKKSSFVAEKKIKVSHIENLSISGGVLKLNKTHLKRRVSSYIASLISAYLTDKLFESQQSFCLESVMSHSGKIQLFHEAHNRNYQTYLYFVYTHDVNINIDRVKDRVRKKGHSVEKEKIISRYRKCFENLRPAMREADKAFLVDNSSVKFQTVLRIDRINGIKEVREDYPEWLNQHYNPIQED